jgi:hypothetical protein
MSILEYHFICDELAYLWFELADQIREAWEDKFLVDRRLKWREELLRSILAQLPLTPGATSSTP